MRISRGFERDAIVINPSLSWFCLYYCVSRLDLSRDWSKGTLAATETFFVSLKHLLLFPSCLWPSKRPLFVEANPLSLYHL